MIFRLTLAIFVALILGLGITYYLNESYKIEAEQTDWQQWFNSQNFDQTKKNVFLIGASQVGRLNATYMQESISKINSDYEIYNLSINVDTPITRINWVPEIVDSKPVLVVYGLTFRDLTGDLPNMPFRFDYEAVIQEPITDVIGGDKPTSILADPEESFNKWIDEQTVIDFSNFDNSQETILNLLGLVPEKRIKPDFRPASEDTPFTHYRKTMNRIVDEERIMKMYQIYLKQGRAFTGYEPGKDIDDQTLKKIITDLKKNDIKVILFSTPIPRYYLDRISDSDIEIFTSALDQIADELDVKVYHFYDKYADMNIWYDLRHVSMNKTANIFSSDIAEIISNEIES